MMGILAGIILILGGTYLIYLIILFFTERNHEPIDIETLGLGDKPMEMATKQYQEMVNEYVDELYKQMTVPKSKMSPPPNHNFSEAYSERNELSKEQTKAIITVFLPAIRKKDPLDILLMPNNMHKIGELERELENILVEGTYNESQKKILNNLRKLKQRGTAPFEE